MKRARFNPREPATIVPKATEKKAKEEPNEAGELLAEAVAAVVAEEEAEMVMEDEWVGLWSGVDEEIAWAHCSCPVWEMEAIEDAFNALYEDVLWDYDIWGFQKSGNNIAPKG